MSRPIKFRGKQVDNGELIECCLTKNHEDNIRWLEHYISVSRINPFDNSDDRVKVANNYLEMEMEKLNEVLC